MKKTVYDLFGDWRILILIAALVLSIFSLSPNPWASGAVVSNVDDGSPFQGKLAEGEVIKSVNDETVTGPNDLIKYENYTGVVRIQTNEGLKLAELNNGSLGVATEEAKEIDLEFGMDLKGGTRVLLQPQFKNETYNETDENRIIDQTISTLRTRLNVFGLKEMNFNRVQSTTGEKFIEIEAAGASRDMINELLSRRGEFEAYVPRVVNFGNSTEAELEVGNDTYTFTMDNGTLFYGSKSLQVNDTVGLGDIQFTVWNTTEDSAVLAGKIFSSEDIKYVYTAGESTYVAKPPGANYYEFSFKILISEESAERFATITQNLDEVRESLDADRRSCHLSQRIHLFLDEKPVTTLGINCGLKGQSVREPLITGAEDDRDKALEERRRLQSILKSGKLPVELETKKVDVISPRLGSELLSSAAIAGAGALLAVAILVFIRYRRKEIIVPVLITSFSEVFIILGAASAIGWTIDLAAIAGIIAAIGSSVDDQIVITSETLMEGEERKSKYSIKRRVKRAFFIVFVAAATTIAAMTTLAFIGIGVMRGFAITTIIGVLAGIFITRPAYGRIIEEVL